MSDPVREAAEREFSEKLAKMEFLGQRHTELLTVYMEGFDKARALPTAGDREALAKLLNDALSEIASLQEARLMAGYEPNAKLADILKRGAILASGFRRDGVRDK